MRKAAGFVLLFLTCHVRCSAAFVVHSFCRLQTLRHVGSARLPQLSSNLARCHPVMTENPMHSREEEGIQEGKQDLGLVPGTPRRTFLSNAVSSQIGALALVSGAARASALGNPFQGLTDECELDACISRDRRVFERAGRKFTITQEFDKNGSKSTGSAVWEGDFVLTKYMETAFPAGFWKGKKVLELGAGTGLASMVAALLGAEDVLLTDGDSKVLELADRNLKANLTPQEASRIKLKQLRWEWAADPAWKLEGGEDFDVVLAADLTYYSGNIPPLMRMMQAISSTPTLLLLTHTVRPTDGDSMQQFYSAFDVDKISSGPAFEGHKETFLYSMRFNPAKKLPEVAEDGCKPGYVKNKQINLCVPKQ